MEVTKTFVVLGMHRSATSLVARGLASEIFMGSDYQPANEFNPEGYWEDLEFATLNDQILRDAGGSWSDPPSERAIQIAGRYYKNKLERLVTQRNEQHELWGFKDPRTTLTYRLWEPYLRNPHLIACFRDPQDVSESLGKRDGFGVNRAMALIDEYNRRLIDILRSHVDC